jgi:exosortase/archaeosortase family protein
MMNIKAAMNSSITKFIIGFILLYVFLYSLNYLLIGVTVPGGIYNKWIANHIDYVSAYRIMILKGASFFVALFGHKGYTDKYTLSIPGIAAVRMVYSCIGFDVLCFWCAFTLAYPQIWRRKLMFTIVGVVAITFLNMLRVGGLVMIRSFVSLRYAHIDHHMLFNIVVYLAIFLMIRSMITRSEHN